MAGSLSKIILSGSADGMPIDISAASSGAAITIHTPVTGTTNLDEVWIWAFNYTVTARKFSCEFGATDDFRTVEMTIDPEEGPHLIIPGWVIQDGANNTVKGFAADANSIGATGYVIRYTN